MNATDDDDLFGGEGRPTDDQILRVSKYLHRHNRDWGPRPTHRELQARGFTISLPTVQRAMKKADASPPPNKDKPAPEASNRVATERANNARPNTKSEPPKVTLEDCALPEGTIQKIASLLVSANTSTHLAIEENRYRMALNIVIAQAMASRPELMLLDMRGTAALVDALTCGAKLSGGASIDITRLPEGADPNQLPMKDITPAPQQTTLAASLADFRRQRAHANGKGT